MTPQTSTGRISQTAYILLHTNPGPLRLPEPERRHDVGAMRRDQGIESDEAIIQMIKACGKPMPRAEIEKALGLTYLYKRLQNLVNDGNLALIRIPTEGTRGGIKTCYYALPGMEKQLEDMG